jgi:hypothetical protein
MGGTEKHPVEPRQWLSATEQGRNPTSTANVIVVDKDTSKRRFQAVQRLEESRHLPAAEAVARPAVVEGAAAFIHTGLPDALKAGVKDLTGMALDHVRVHYNSR